eukprot:scaffold155209_cov18-Tisochrysis_lutea.AAC.1
MAVHNECNTHDAAANCVQGQSPASHNTAPMIQLQTVLECSIPDLAAHCVQGKTSPLSSHATTPLRFC